MLDFSLHQYAELLRTLKDRNYTTCTFKDFFLYNNQPKLPGKIVCLRHDVDRLPVNALKMAELEYQVGIQSTYYFRYIKTTYKKDIIQQIAKYGHEIGYHYETLTKARGDIVLAHSIFKEELEAFRQIVPIDTVCMHGSPLSKYDNRAMWKHHSIKNYNILAEPYLSIDYSQVEYYTDTGRQWGATKTNLRDIVTNSKINPNLKTTNDLINYLITIGPQKIILQTHPERWAYSYPTFIFSLILDGGSNLIKFLIHTLRSKGFEA